MTASRATTILRSAKLAIASVPFPPAFVPLSPPRRPRSTLVPSPLSQPAFAVPPSSSSSSISSHLTCMVCHTSAADSSAPVSPTTPSSHQDVRPASLLAPPQLSTSTFVAAAAVSTTVALVSLDASSQQQHLQHQHQPVLMELHQGPNNLSSSPQPHPEKQPLDQTPQPTLSTSTVTTAESPDTTPASDNPPEPVASSYTLRSGFACFPHPEKADKGGEDAFFIQSNALGVFDGVGGWASIGVDAGLYSKELARLTANYVDRHGPQSIVEALRNANDNNAAVGSSTACVVAVQADTLMGVNLGDSGLIVIRNGNIVYRTTEQQHYFNCPYQIGTDSLDTVDVACPINFVLKPGDWIIMGTDGLWDNVFHTTVVDIVMSHISSPAKKDQQPMQVQQQQQQADLSKVSNDFSSDGASVSSDCSAMDICTEEAQLIAQSLADAACKVANDENSTSPFAVNAQNAGHPFLGGKVDDITIIAALVTDPEASDPGSCKSDMQDVSTAPNNSSASL